MAKTNPPPDPQTEQPDDAAVAARLGASPDQLKGLDLAVIGKVLALAAQYGPAVWAMISEIVEAWKRQPKQGAIPAAHPSSELAAQAHGVAVKACDACCAAWQHAAACGHQH